MPSSQNGAPIGQVIAVVNGKGGAGKTTLSVHLSEGLAEKRHKTLLLDVDPQESASAWGDVETQLKADTQRVRDFRELGKLIAQERRRYRYIVIDTAPVLYGQALRVVVDEADAVLIPSAADVIIELTRTIATAREIEFRRKPYLVVLNRVDSRALDEADTVRRELESVDIAVAKSNLRLLKAYKRAANEQTVAWRSSHPSAAEAQKDMQSLMVEVQRLLTAARKRERKEPVHG
jgi:chromosome partitioning protein